MWGFRKSQIKRLLKISSVYIKNWWIPSFIHLRISYLVSPFFDFFKKKNSRFLTFREPCEIVKTLIKGIPNRKYEDKRGDSPVFDFFFLLVPPKILNQVFAENFSCLSQKLVNPLLYLSSYFLFGIPFSFIKNVRKFEGQLPPKNM